MRSARPGSAAVAVALAGALLLATACATPAPPPGGVSGSVSAPAGDAERVLVYLDPVGAGPGPRALAMAAPARERLSELLAARIGGARGGASLVIENDTQIFHRLFSRSEPGGFAPILIPSGEGREIPLPAAGEVRLYCELHPGEIATLLAAPSPWVVRAEPSGAFGISGVSPGDYRLVAWSERGARGSARVRVPPGATVRVEIPGALPGQRER